MLTLSLILRRFLGRVLVGLANDGEGGEWEWSLMAEGNEWTSPPVFNKAGFPQDGLEDYDQKKYYN